MKPCSHCGVAALCLIGRVWRVREPLDREDTSRLVALMPHPSYSGLRKKAVALDCPRRDRKGGF